VETLAESLKAVLILFFRLPNRLRDRLSVVKESNLSASSYSSAGIKYGSGVLRIDPCPSTMMGM
jgi:hypothetical protein